MTIKPPDNGSNLSRQNTKPLQGYQKMARRLHLSPTKLTLCLLSILLLSGSLAIYHLQSSLLAAQAGSDKACNWHIISAGETLTLIARQYHTTISTLTHTNSIPNANLIFVGKRLCIPRPGSATPRGIQANGKVSWYNYQALDWSNRSQVHDLLCQVAISHHLPTRLVLAIAWQESGWTQHVIAWDGGIGVMQLMPYTAMNINSGLGQQLDPYDLQDNVNLGATYLAWLWDEFDGNLPEVISGYNEGGWAVQHQGIFNWHYVNNVMSLMQNMN